MRAEQPCTPEQTTLISPRCSTYDHREAAIYLLKQGLIREWYCVRGVGIKVCDVGGKKVSDHEKNAKTQDFLMININFMVVHNVHDIWDMIFMVKKLIFRPAFISHS